MPLFQQPTSVIPEAVPASPITGQVWVNPVGLIGSPGLAMGPMGMTYTTTVVDKYLLTYQTTENIAKQVEIT